MHEVRTETAQVEKPGIPSGILLQQCKNETAKSLLGARTKSFDKLRINLMGNSCFPARPERAEGLKVVRQNHAVMCGPDR
jgi:hypothetical protein